MSALRSTRRVVGVDIARFVALAGMMATHILPATDAVTGEVGAAHLLAGGRASALFAVLAGVSLALTTGRTTPVRGRAFVAAAAGIAVRAVLVATVGLALGELDTMIAVILTYYGVLFVLGIPFLVLRARWLWILAGLWLVLAPVLSHVVRPRLPPRPFANPSFDSLGDPGLLLGELTFSGFYPAVPWLAYLLVGLAIGRTDLTRWRTTLLLAVGGGVLATVAITVSDALLRRPGVMDRLSGPYGSPETLRLMLDAGLAGTTPTDTWWWLAVRGAHTGTPLDLAQTIGSAMVVIAVCLALGRLAPSLTAVVFGAGAMTLSLYAAHVALRVDLWTGETMSTYLGQVGAALAVGAVFALVHRRGPLEAAVGVISNAVRSRV